MVGLVAAVGAAVGCVGGVEESGWFLVDGETVGGFEAAGESEVMNVFCLDMSSDKLRSDEWEMIDCCVRW